MPKPLILDLTPEKRQQAYSIIANCASMILNEESEDNLEKYMDKKLSTLLGGENTSFLSFIKQLFLEQLSSLYTDPAYQSKIGNLEKIRKKSMCQAVIYPQNDDEVRDSITNIFSWYKNSVPIAVEEGNPHHLPATIPNAIPVPRRPR